MWLFFSKVTPTPSPPNMKAKMDYFHTPPFDTKHHPYPSELDPCMWPGPPSENCPVLALIRCYFLNIWYFLYQLFVETAEAGYWLCLLPLSCLLSALRENIQNQGCWEKLFLGWRKLLNGLIMQKVIIFSVFKGTSATCVLFEWIPNVLHIWLKENLIT